MNDKLLEASDAVHADRTHEEQPGRYKTTWSAEDKPGAMIVTQPGAGVLLAVHRAGSRYTGPLIAIPVPCDRRRKIKRLEFVVTYEEDDADAANTPHPYVKATGHPHRNCECCAVCWRDPHNSVHRVPDAKVEEQPTKKVDHELETRNAELETGLRELLGGLFDGYVDGGLVARLRALVGGDFTTKPTKIELARRLLDVWDAICSAPPDVDLGLTPEEFTEWSGITKDVLLKLGMEWVGSRDMYGIPGPTIVVDNVTK